MTAPTPPPAALRDILAEVLSAIGVFCGVCDHEAACPDCEVDLHNIADAILSDPRIAVTLAPTSITFGMPAPDLSRLPAWDGYLDAMGDDNAIQYWREIRASIYRPINEWLEQNRVQSNQSNTTNRGDQS